MECFAYFQIVWPNLPKGPKNISYACVVTIREYFKILKNCHFRRRFLRFLQTFKLNFSKTIKVIPKKVFVLEYMGHKDSLFIKKLAISKKNI